MASREASLHVWQVVGMARCAGMVGRRSGWKLGPPPVKENHDNNIEQLEPAS